MSGAAAAQAAAEAPGAAGPIRFAHRRAAEGGPPQEVWIAFGGRADQLWLRLLRPGFRHCFAALRDPDGWTVVDPLSGRLLVVRLDLAAGFDLPGFYRRAGFAVLGPFRAGGARPDPFAAFRPFTCVALCRALLGAGAPFAVTPFGLFRALSDHRKKILTGDEIPR